MKKKVPNPAKAGLGTLDHFRHLCPALAGLKAEPIGSDHAHRRFRYARKDMVLKSKENSIMSILDQQWFSSISRPSRYIGNEVNSIKKDPSQIEVSIALVFPDIYEIGMSHIGLKILYHILNSHHWLTAERAFSPWIDLEKELRHRKIPLTTLESNLPLSDFDIVGFSLQHELCYTNVLNILALCNIPFLARKRSDADPLIIAGGPACFNPEPVAEFFDAIVVGDGEDAALEICRTVRKAKHRNINNRRDILSSMHRIRGIYVPSCFNVIYRPDGTVDAIEPFIPYYRFVEKALIPDIEEYPFPDRQVVPFTGLVHDRLAVEISRGCTRGCRFCQAGMTYRPVRERAPESILETSEKALRLTGYDDISLLSLSSGDYSSIGPLLTALMDRQSNNKVAVSLPSLRIDTLDAPLMEQIKRVRKTGFTLAPEAGNDRLRTIINKGLRQKDILETARAVYGMGWNLIKLYFMIGLPFEEEKDLQDIINLAKQIVGQAGRKGKRAKLNVSISTFVPKSHTPFMWYPQITSKESRRRVQFIRNGLKGSPVRVKWNQPELSWLEGIFSRGDRRLSRALMEAWRLGARFDAWGECFQIEIWKKAFKATGVNPDFYLHRKRSPSETMPWDHIKSGVTKEYLKREWKKAQTEIQTPDCREKCLECGVCDHKIVDPVLFKDWDSPGMKNLSTAPPIPESRKYCLTFTKLDHARYLGHLELVSVFIRALKRAGLNLVYSRGFHPMPKMSFACALPVGTESIQETVDIEVAGKGDVASLKNIINRQLPDGISVTSVDEIPHNTKRQLLIESHFLMTLNGLELKKDDLDKFLMSDDFPVVKINKKGEHKINARPLVKSLKLISPDEIELVIQHLSGPQLKPAEIVKSIFTLKDSQATGIKILKTKQILE